MTAIPFALGSFQRRASRMPELRLLNCYPEIVEQTPVLIGRPALVAHSTVGTGPVRGVYSEDGVFSGDVFAVSGGSLFRDATSIGAIAGGDRAFFAASSSLLLALGGGLIHAYNGTALTVVAFPDSAPVVWIGRLGGYFLAIRGNDSQRFYWSTDGLTWNALDFASAERRPDPLIGGLVIGDELWLFGTKTVEFFYQTTDTDAPFQRIAGRAYQRGCAARDTIALHDNAATWVGDNRIVFRGGAVPERISTHSIEERLEAEDVGNLRAWAFTWSGHEFYCLTIGAQGTFVYDPATQQWGEWGSYGLDYWRAHVGTTASGQIICGDAVNGNLYTLSDDVSLDGSGIIVREFAAILPTDQPVACYSLTIEAAVGATASLSGQGANPQVEMRYSDDYGNTWGPWEAVSLGAQGEYRVRPQWNGLGLVDAPGRVFQFRLADPAPWRITRVGINDNLKGKAR